MCKRIFFVAAVVLLTTVACKPEPAELGAANGVEATADDAMSAGQPSTRDQDPQAGQAPTQGGAFARAPGFQLPVPVSNAPVASNSAATVRGLDPVAIRSAVQEGLADSDATVQVQVNPNGIVSLSGEVGSVAELQHVHYLARAQPGVVEIDYRNLRVRQR